jgi:hypothetical protein
MSNESNQKAMKIALHVHLVTSDSYEWQSLAGHMHFLVNIFKQLHMI